MMRKRIYSAGNSGGVSGRAGRKNIVVVGSMNMDLVVNCHRLPRPGETIPGEKFSTHPGGKGANQAAAAGRLGGKPLFIGARGEDDFGRELQERLTSMGVTTELKITDAETGTAHIMVTAEGENHIIIIAGANGELRPGDITDRSDLLKNAGYLLLQLEIPLETVSRAAEIATENDVSVILDPAPACQLPAELLKKVDILLPNQQELEQLTADRFGSAADGSAAEEKERVQHLFQQGVKNILLTRGAAGARLYCQERQKNQQEKKARHLNNRAILFSSYDIAAPEVEAIDTTAAGDALAGALAVALSRGLTLREAAELGVIYGSAAVTAAGAQSSLLTARELIEKMPEATQLMTRIVN